MYDPGRRKIRKLLKQHVCFFISAKAYDHSFFMEDGKTAPAGKNRILKGSAGHEKSSFMTKGCTFKTGYQR